jgi:hypothetical protein
MGVVADVCVCTHDPRRDVLAIAMAALARQTARGAFAVTVVDNASVPALGVRELAPLAGAGIPHRLVRERRLGNAYARARALAETDAPIAVFVDDDNELAADYLARALAILGTDRSLGVIGGRLLRAPDLEVPGWLEPLRSYIGIRDDAAAAVTEVVRDSWSIAVPPSAGMAMRREVAALYVELATAGEGAALAGIGRVGRGDLGSCEDLLLARLAHRVGLACGYRPELSLVHHIDPARLQLGYVMRLMFGQGASEARVDRLLEWRRGGMTMRAAPSVRDPRTLLCLAARAAGRYYATR